MLTLAVPNMAKASEKQWCEYVGTKIDNQVHPLARAAAALVGKHVQDFISDAVNDAAAKVLKREPIKRRPPEPKNRKPKDAK